MPEQSDPLADRLKILAGQTEPRRDTLAPAPGGEGNLWDRLQKLGGEAEQQKPPDPGRGVSLWEGLTQGLGNVYRGAEGLGVKALGGIMGRPDLSAEHERQMGQREEAFKQTPAMQHHPGYARGGEIGGEVLGTAPLAVGGGGLPLAGRAGIGALQGGAISGLLSRGDPKQATIGAGLGGGAGLAGGVIGPRLNEAYQTISQKYPDLFNMATGRFGRTVDNFQIAAANFALRPIGQQLERSAKLGKDLLDKVGDKISDAYNAVLPSVTFRPHAPDPYTGQTFMDVVPNIRAQIPRARRRDFDDVIKNHITDKLDPAGNLDGAGWKRVDHVIGEKAARYERSTVADEKYYGEALRELQENMRDTLWLHNPSQQPALEAADQAWSRYAQMRLASGRKAGDDFFSPSDIVSTVRDRVGRSRFAQTDNDMKAFGRAGEDLIAGRPANWQRILGDTAGATIGGMAGYKLGHSLGGPVGGYIGGGLGMAAGAGATEAGRRLTQLPAARGLGQVVQHGGVPAAGVAAGQPQAPRRSTLREREPDEEPYVGTAGP